MITFTSKIFNEPCLKNTHRLLRDKRMHYFEKKKPQKLQIVQHFFGFQLAEAAPVLLLWQRAVNRQPGSRSDNA